MSIAEDAKRLYENDLKQSFEPDHWGEFLAIEPDSKAFFLGNSYIEAALAAKQAYPNQKSFVLRIGYKAAFHLGAG